ncbi:bacterio-opsin activator domain-containing protein [Natrinema salaciae]|uniref:PAS domain S-box-containing protein n=1 Tax=Natrinema salaciae TaxID=1186196 RepID=A0A1H9A7R6_9EURY|nr:bacterio-opsin activator domain-containing protein [Natrinema salaciae]SEP72493.1 PAS domain S-box-containing protein [Natrinema salaciae]
MSDGTVTVVDDAPCVLVVGDTEPVDDAMDALATGFDGATLLRERTLEGALERLTDREVHCLVCPFVAPDERSGSGESLVERLAARADDRPIVAVVDGGEADRALAAGASDVVDRDESATVLTARVETAAERERYRLAASRPAHRYRSILEHAAAIVWVLDADGGVEYASPAVESRMGYTPTELERTTITRLVHPDDRDAAREALASVAAAPVGTTERLTLRLGHADGTWHVSELACTNRLEDPAVDGIVVTRTGVPSATADAVGDGARAGLDRLAAPFFAIGPRGELQYANEAAIRLVPGIDRSSDDGVPTGAVVWELLPPNLGGTIADSVREAETTDSVVETETTVPSIEGRLAIAVHPGDDGVSIWARERTPEDAASPAAGDRDRLALLESVVDALDDGLAVLEGSTVRLANPALLELAGADALVGRDVADLFDDELAAAVRERARSAVVRWMDPVSGTLEPDRDGAPVPVDVVAIPLPGPDRTLCVVRDGRNGPRAALPVVRRTVAALRRADTPVAVREAVVDAIREFASADVAVWYHGDADRLRPAAVSTATDRASDAQPARSPDAGPSIEPLSIDPDGTPLSDLLEGGRPTVFDRSAFADVLARTGVRAERVLAVPVAGRGVVLATSTEPMAFGGLDLDPIDALSDAGAVALESLERADDLRACRHDRSRLQTVAERAERLRETERSMLRADTREDVERRLCEAAVSLGALESDDGIELAWVGRADDGPETLEPTTWAGRDGEFLESTTVPLGPDVGAPAGTAAATREPALIQDLATSETARGDAAEAGRTWRRRLLERGFRSALSVPISSGAFHHGTLTVYAGRPSAFDERTRRVCTHLASIAGSAIGALRTKAALLADRVTELEVVCRDDAEPLSAIAHRLGERLDVRAVVPRSSGGSTVFCSVAAAESAAVRAPIESLPAVDSVSIVGQENGDPVLEIVLPAATAPPIARTVADHGGVLRSVTPVDERTRLAIDLGDPIGVRPFVQALERVHPGTELLARRERDRSPRSARVVDALIDELTDQQRRTLEAAYYGGFFEWPREHTGEEVAESLGISQPTFSRHLRTAERKLFELLFDGSTGD